RARPPSSKRHASAPKRTRRSRISCRSGVRFHAATESQFPLGFKQRSALFNCLRDAPLRLPPPDNAVTLETMPDAFENPLGLDGFEFLEFSAPAKGVLEPAFEQMGFSLVARHRSKDVQLWRQGGINFIADYEPQSPAAYFAAEH